MKKLNFLIGEVIFDNQKNFIIEKIEFPYWRDNFG